MNVALIITAAALEKANALAEAMGWGPNSYSVPLYTGEEITHYGLNLAEAQPEFLAMLAAAGEGEMPEALASAGYPMNDFADVMSDLSVWTNISFADALAACSLKVVADEPA